MSIDQTEITTELIVCALWVFHERWNVLNVLIAQYDGIKIYLLCVHRIQNIFIDKIMPTK